MGYMGHMQQLIKCITYLIELGIKLIATEKYHGTSTSITQKLGKEPTFYSGGEVAEVFEEIFDKKLIQERLDVVMKKNSWASIRVYGEAHGGCHLFPRQMADTYGNKTLFRAFDIKVNLETPKQQFLDFFATKEIVEFLGLNLVHYEECPYDITMENTNKIIEWLEEQTNLYSTSPHNMNKDENNRNLREGIVVRPITESVIGKKRERAICKNVNENFKEKRTFEPGKISNKVKMSDKIRKVSKYDEIASEWITENRGRHVLDEIRANRDNKNIIIKDIRIFLEKIVEDVKAESVDEFEWPLDTKEELELCRVLKKEASFIFGPLCEEFNYELKS
jgi:RNA ligase